MFFVESIRYVMVFRVYQLLLLGVRELGGLNLDEERRYPEDLHLNILSRNADWSIGWTVRGSNPDTGYILFVSPKYPENCGPQSIYTKKV